jgi:hypothetical protein
LSTTYKIIVNPNNKGDINKRNSTIDIFDLQER